VVDGLVTIGDKVLGSDGTWTDVAEVPVPREFPGTAAHGGRLYVWGGSGCGPGASCAGFVQVPEGMTWSPTAPPAPAAEPGSFELDGGLVCGPTDAIELDLTMTSPASRYVTAELVIAGKLAAGPEVTYVVAGEGERFDSDLMRVVSRAERSHEEGVLRVRDHASGDVLAEQVVSLRLPPGIQCG
jgi:hypothetical protein